ncbi:MAG: hypothetical protein CL578_22525 [Alteromonadaceae bacterium]|uniref:hypothetical protein n=1 Tax=unclassified Methylophaga TaxID=2629249 RepID=UPI000C6B6375|nr:MULTISPECIES: hypothetical protein [unclassified Methylophaga]MAP27761.1 hypothetical protein [Methylophaga sp.]MBN27804.1 hypothetical protein [Alteromonadaceae bacterium]HAD31552.1 hypothetical protein [Methylophaga sp.]HBX59847.1 hypothetical protein [Methylophaga sp.]
MIAQNLKEFDIALCEALAIFDKHPPEPSVVEFWMNILSPYSIEQVKRAFKVHVAKSHFAPKPADIIEIINQQDGRPSADEAWPIALQGADENTTAVWTEEIAQAWYHCQPVFESGDEIGARMAFRQHYQRQIEHSRMTGQPIRWTVSLGHDQAQKKTALEVAQQKGLISQSRVTGLLPSPEPTGDGQHIAALVGYDGTFEAPITNESKAGFKKLREALASSTPEPRVNKVEQQKQDEQKRRDELAEQERLLLEARNRYQEQQYDHN